MSDPGEFVEAGLRAGRECLAAALDYLARGWSVLGLCPPDHVGVGKAHAQSCDHQGKRPLPDGGTWKRWQAELPDRATVEGWWHTYPNMNVGCALGGVTGLVRVDVEGEAAQARLSELAGGEPPVTLEFTSGRGRGLLYRLPPGEWRTGVEGVGDGDLRFQAGGAQTVLPPSRHKDGPRYAWLPGRSPAEREAAPAPAWLLERLGVAGASAAAPAVPDGEVIHAGACDTTLAAWAGAMRKRGMSKSAIEAALLAEIEAGRCETAPGKRPYDASDAARIAASVGKYEPDAYANVVLRFTSDAKAGTNGQHTPAVELPALPRALTHNQLLDKQFPPQRWLLEGLLPAGGLVFLGGKKKLGKSWLCLQIAQAVGAGRSTLGKPAAQGRVVYVCLEDGGRRLQDRLVKQQSPRGLPIDWYTSFTKLDAGGLEQVKRLLEPQPALFVLDTLAAAKSGRLDENASGPMADLSNALRDMAQESGTGVLTTHHHGKFSYGDPGDDLRGSSALGAAADLNLGLYKLDDGFRLRGEGRDVEPFDYAVTFDAHGTWLWQVLGDARAVAQDEADQAVLFALANLGEADAEAVAEAVNRKRQTVNERLNNLVRQKRVLVRLEPTGRRGPSRVLYRLPEPDAPLPD